MPRIGSLTQRPRQPTRWGANTWPMAGQGFTRMAAITGQEYAPGPELQWSPALGALGHSMPQPFYLRAPQFTGSFTIPAGVTRDSSGAPLAGCTVRLFRDSAFNEFLGQTVSDGSGNFQFTVPDQGPFWIVAYRPGSPDVAGTTIRGLTASG